MTYESPHGKAPGLVARLLGWVDRMGTDRNLPWAGLGIIGDIKLAAQILNSREFLENLRTHGTPDEAEWAQILLADLDTLEAVESAVYTAGSRRDLGPDGQWTDPPRAIEILAEQATEAERDYRAVRDVLVSTGALSADDTETPVADLVRALLS